MVLMVEVVFLVVSDVVAVDLLLILMAGLLSHLHDLGLVIHLLMRCQNCLHHCCLHLKFVEKSISGLIKMTVQQFDR